MARQNYRLFNYRFNVGNISRTRTPKWDIKSEQFQIEETFKTKSKALEAANVLIMKLSDEK